MAITTTWLGYLTSDVNASTYSLGNITVPSDGLLVAAGVASGLTTRTIDSFSLGGEAATYLECSEVGGNCVCGATRFVSAGDHAVEFHTSSASQRGAAGLWLLEGAVSATPYDTQFQLAAGTGNIAMTVDYPAGGAGIYGLIKTGIANVVWNNASEDADFTLESTTAASFAHRSASGTAIEEIASWTGTLVPATMAMTFEATPPPPGPSRRRLLTQILLAA